MKQVLKKVLGLRENKNPHEQISYAQTGEDIIVDFIFKYILLKPEFTYFDIGAHHPYFLSNTAIFYKRGFKGLSVEPDPTLFNEIKNERPHEKCLNIGIDFSEENDIDKELDFYIMSVPTLNTFSKHEAERLHSHGQYTIKEIKKIKVCHIHKLFNDYFIPDFLSIDVEGIDFEILKSIDFARYRPNVICVETAEFDPIPPGKKDYAGIDYLMQKDYLNYADTFNNTILIDKKYLAEVHARQ